MFDIVNVSFHFFHLYGTGTVLPLSRTVHCIIIFLLNQTHPVHSIFHLFVVFANILVGLFIFESNKELVI